MADRYPVMLTVFRYSDNDSVIKLVKPIFSLRKLETNLFSEMHM